MAQSTVDRPAKPGVAASAEVGVGYILSKSELFKKRPPKAREVHIPGAGTVRMASMTGGQHGDIAKRHEVDGQLRATVGYMAEVIAACLVDVDGKRMFDDVEDGAKQVKQLDLPVVIAMFTAAAQTSAMTAEAREELGKGSEQTPDDAD